MAKIDAHVVLYVVDLQELRDWIGCKDPKRFNEAWEAIRDDDEWDKDALGLLQDLLSRVIFEGKLYDGLDDSERYLMTQILVDLFDEFVDQDAISEDIPLDRFVQVVDELPRGSEAARMSKWLVRGREFDGEKVLWEGGPDRFASPFFGFVTREECPKLMAALDEAGKRQRTRPSGILKQLRAAADECARAELDLLAYVG
ncbi:MAG: hypothetical protein K0Q72_1055 [Armatimonadetes bacterium]|jgi:hypothetical protein|nr:hypothetical protein [Armatimonadota bacterium]